MLDFCGFMLLAAEEELSNPIVLECFFAHLQVHYFCFIIFVLGYDSSSSVFCHSLFF